VIFPGSVSRNVAFGLRGEVPRRRWPERVEEALREAALWDEVKDRLDEPAVELSVGQQQRLCLARALALEPEVVLMDEPTGSLDPASTRAIEEQVRRLAEHRTAVLVTHDLGQARRVSDRLGVVLRRHPDPAAPRGISRGSRGTEREERVGELVEVGPTETLFRRPRDPEVAAYLGAERTAPSDGAPNDAAPGDCAANELAPTGLSVTESLEPAAAPWR
jgi:phosphate transport system ATP-binding protein